MQNELFRYARRGLGNALRESNNEEFQQTVLMLKMIESNIVSKIVDISGGSAIRNATSSGVTAVVPLRGGFTCAGTRTEADTSIDTDTLVGSTTATITKVLVLVLALAQA